MADLQYAGLRRVQRGGPRFAKLSIVGIWLVTHCYGRNIRLTCFVAGLLFLLGVGACRSGVPVVDPSEPSADVDGTVSGTVRGPEGTSAIEGREVAVVNVATGERQKVTTNATGGFSFKVKPGKYRVEITLLQGEAIIKQPGVITVNRSDVDAHADFVIGSTNLSRPRFAAPRGDDGLGSPIA